MNEMDEQDRQVGEPPSFMTGACFYGMDDGALGVWPVEDWGDRIEAPPRRSEVLGEPGEEAPPGR